MPTDTGMSFVIDQNLSPEFESRTNQLLGRLKRISISVISNRKLLLTDRSPEKVLLHPINIASPDSHRWLASARS